jgi:hypothetical protein
MPPVRFLLVNHLDIFYNSLSISLDVYTYKRSIILHAPPPFHAEYERRRLVATASARHRAGRAVLQRRPVDRRYLAGQAINLAALV